MKSYEVVKTVPVKVSEIINQCKIAIYRIELDKSILKDKIVDALQGFKTGPWYNKEYISFEEAEDIVECGKVTCLKVNIAGLSNEHNIYSQQITDLVNKYRGLTTRKFKQIIDLCGEYDDDHIMEFNSECWLEITKHSGKYQNRKYQ